MSENHGIAYGLSGSKRRPQQELGCFDEPAAKTRRRLGGSDDYGFDSSTNIVRLDKQNNSNSHNKTKNESDDAWNKEQHMNFVSSIFEIGLKNASPAIILENMTQKVETITSERVKSKLQKYRSNKNKVKSKQEFMENYCQFFERIKSMQSTSARPRFGIHHPHQGVDGVSSDPLLSLLLEDMGSGNSGDNNKPLLLGGDVAGYLTHCVMEETKQTKNAEGQSSVDSNTSSSLLPTNVMRKGAREYVDNYAGCAIKFPILTDVEKKSSLGIAMTFIAGLFLTMSQHLTSERASAETIGLELSSSTISDAAAPDGGTSQPKSI